MDLEAILALNGEFHRWPNSGGLVCLTIGKEDIEPAVVTEPTLIVRSIELPRALQLLIVHEIGIIPLCSQVYTKLDRYLSEIATGNNFAAFLNNMSDQSWTSIDCRDDMNPER